MQYEETPTPKELLNRLVEILEATCAMANARTRDDEILELVVELGDAFDSLASASRSITGCILNRMVSD